MMHVERVYGGIFHITIYFFTAIIHGVTSFGEWSERAAEPLRLFIPLLILLRIILVFY